MPANAGAIARICHRLDGIPLAIELAAARVAVLSPEQIEGRLHDRFRLLTGGARTAVARQRTLEATVDWSFQLLSATERLMLARLSIFPAAWSLEAAEHVCGAGGIDPGDVLPLLVELVSKSLVVVEGSVDGVRRYRFLETIRQFARDRLVEIGESEECRRRHFEFFWQEFRGALPILRHHQQLACLRRVGIEQDNLRAALDWALSAPSGHDGGVELAGALFWFWTKRGLYEEGRLWLERAEAAASPADSKLRARVLIGLAHMRHFQMRPFDDLVSEALMLGRTQGDPWTISFALFMQGLAEFERGDHALASARSNEARAAAGPGEELLIHHSGPLLILANVAVSRGDYETAQQLYDEAIEVNRRTGEAWSLGILLSASAGLRIVRGELLQAHAQASEALSICQELEDPRGIAWSLDVFAGVLAAAGRADAAARSWGAADRLLESVGGALSQEIRWIRARYLDPARLAIGSQHFDTARAAGREMPLPEAIARARTEAGALRR
jgi:non-specific serine/threonine protein kinase